jgi:hypothetical protein
MDPLDLLVDAVETFEEPVTEVVAVVTEEVVLPVVDGILDVLGWW